MKRNRIFTITFLSISILLFLANIAIVLIFSAVNVQESFYKALNVASISIAFLSFIASSFFSLSVYLQSKEQTKINEKLPQKEDQYIIANYSLFNIEREVSLFTLGENERAIAARRERFLSVENGGSGERLTRLVFLPTDSVNTKTYKVMVRRADLFNSDDELIYSAHTSTPIDGEYSANILQRGYNCICADVADDISNILAALEKSERIDLELDIISVFGVNMRTVFSIHLEGEKDVEGNPDKKKLPDLRTYTIHHTNYVIVEKTIISTEN